MTTEYQSQTEHRGIGLLLVVIAAVAFSAKAIFVKLAYRYGVDAVTLLALRMGMAMPFFAYIALREERRAAVRPDSRQIVAVVALGLVGSGHMIGRLGTIRFTAHAMVVSSLAVMAQFLLTRSLALLVQPMPVYALGLAMALVSTVLPAFLMSAGIRRIGAGPAAMAASVGPGSTIVLAALVLGEPITMMQLAGLALVLTGVGLISVRPPQAQTPVLERAPSRR